MSEFSAEWLSLREPADQRARSVRVTRAVVGALPRGRVIRVVDLGAGSGSNVRFLSPSLPRPQEWLLVDRSPDLLERAHNAPGITIETRVADLSRVGALTNFFASCDLVTASALLDLVSDEWLAAVCAKCRERRTVVLFALSYDGRIVCSPADADDVLVRGLVNRHQRTDKGFGRALGPEAPERAACQLEALGYQVVRDRSDWILEPDSGELQRQLIEGWAAAAMAVKPADRRIISAWRERRIEHVAGQRSRLIVGHEDLAAFIA